MTRKRKRGEKAKSTRRTFSKLRPLVETRTTVIKHRLKKVLRSIRFDTSSFQTKLTNQAEKEGIFNYYFTRFVNMIIIHFHEHFDELNEEELHIFQTIQDSQTLQKLSSLIIHELHNNSKRIAAKDRLLRLGNLSQVYHQFMDSTKLKFTDELTFLHSNSRNYFMRILSTNIKEHLQSNFYIFLRQYYMMVHNITNKSNVLHEDLITYYNNNDLDVNPFSYDLHSFVALVKLINTYCDGHPRQKGAKRRSVAPLGRCKSMFVTLDARSMTSRSLRSCLPQVEMSWFENSTPQARRLTRRGFKLQLFKTDGYQVALYYTKDTPIRPNEEPISDKNEVEQYNDVEQQVIYRNVDNAIEDSLTDQKKASIVEEIGLENIISVDPGKKIHLCCSSIKRIDEHDGVIFEKKDFSSAQYAFESTLIKGRKKHTKIARKRKGLYRRIKTSKTSNLRQFRNSLKLGLNDISKLARDSTKRRSSRFEYYCRAKKYFAKIGKFFRGKMVVFGAAKFQSVKGPYPTCPSGRMIKEIRRECQRFYYQDEYKTTKLCFRCGNELKTPKNNSRDIRHCTHCTKNVKSIEIVFETLPHSISIKCECEKMQGITYSRDFNASINIMLNWLHTRKQWRRVPRVDDNKSKQ